MLFTKKKIYSILSSNYFTQIGKIISKIKDENIGNNNKNEINDNGNNVKNPLKEEINNNSGIDDKIDRNNIKNHIVDNLVTEK